jgi:hypothetical protein
MTFKAKKFVAGVAQEDATGMELVAGPDLDRWSRALLSLPGYFSGQVQS